MEVIIIEPCVFRAPKFPNVSMKNQGLIVKADGIKFIISEDYQPFQLSRMKKFIDYVPKSKVGVKFELCNKDFNF